MAENKKVVMNGKDAITGSMAECYVTINDTRYNFMTAIKFEAKIEKTKTEVPVLGKTGKANKSTGWKGTGSMTIHYNTSVFRELLEKYKNSGEDIYFTLQVKNEDPTSAVGMQEVILKDCNVDGGIIAQFDAGAEYLEEEVSFTFDDWELKQSFKILPGFIN